MIEISIVMVVYNQAEFVVQAILSCLKQTYKNFELLILDDASTDLTWKYLSTIKDRRIKRFRNIKRLGLARGLNFLIHQSKGKYIARMDGDDLSLPNRLKIEKNALDQDNNLALIGSWAQIINIKGNIIGSIRYPTNHSQLRLKILCFNPFVHASIMFRKYVFVKLGGYNERYFYSQDYDFYLKLITQYKVRNINQYLIKYRWHPDYIKQKQQHLSALQIRFHALKHYGYSKLEAIKIIKPIIFYLIPTVIKKKYWQYQYHEKN